MKHQDFLFWTVLLVLVGVWTVDSVMDFGLVPNPMEVQAPSSNEPVTFEAVRPIFQDRCVKCHSSSNWNWTDYETAYAKRVQIRDRVWVLRSMPLGQAMPEAERMLVRDWVDSGAQK